MEIPHHYNKIRQTKSRPFQCPQCPSKFAAEQYIGLHISTFHNKELSKHRCLFCDAAFINDSNLQRHMRSHTKERPYLCRKCPSECSSTNALLNHYKSVHEEKQRSFQCDMCPASFFDRYMLASHCRIHTNERPHKCHLCKNSFKRTDHLQRHLRTHTGERPYKCEVCQKGFGVPGDLKSHKRLHSGIKPFVCHYCERRFNQKGHLRSHIKSQHTNDLPFKCKVCSKRFTHAYILKSHMKTHRERKLDCEICGKLFKREGDALKHIARHSPNV